jgi:hypothetical protein
MEIGHTSESCTSFPKFIDYTDENLNLRFCDLPGTLILEVSINQLLMHLP